MSPQKITEWLFSTELLKGVVGAGVSGSVILYVSILAIDHKINLEKVQSEARFTQIENRFTAEMNAVYRYVDSEKELNKLRFKTIDEKLGDIKEILKKAK